MSGRFTAVPEAPGPVPYKIYLRAGQAVISLSVMGLVACKRGSLSVTASAVLVHFLFTNDDVTLLRGDAPW